MTDNKNEITEKAGGVIIRQNKQGGLEICIIYRSRHDDWSVPKGHIKEDETPVQAAIREVGEETGFYCSIDKTLPPFFYQTPKGEHVVVHFFQMSLLDDGLETDDEVDQLEWMSIDEAKQKISYASLVKYLQQVLDK